MSKKKSKMTISIDGNEVDSVNVFSESLSDVIGQACVNSGKTQRQKDLERLERDIKEFILNGKYDETCLIDVKSKDYAVVYVDYDTSDEDEFIQQYLSDISWIKRLFKQNNYGDFTHICICPHLYSYDANGDKQLAFYNTLIFHTNESIFDLFKYHFKRLKEFKKIKKELRENRNNKKL